MPGRKPSTDRRIRYRGAQVLRLGREGAAGALELPKRKGLLMRYVVGFLCVCALGLVLACGCSSDSDLPTRFGDCASPPCEVALEAFTTMIPGVVRCESSRDAVALSCPATANQLLLAGTCDGYWAVRSVYYAFTGDFYECIYDANQGELVGAKWCADQGDECRLAPYFIYCKVSSWMPRTLKLT